MSSTTDTLWCGNTDGKLYLQSGRYSSTLKTSEDISGIDATIVGISWNGVDTPWAGAADVKLYITSGRFSSTIKTSEDVSAVDTIPIGISYDILINTLWAGVQAGKLYLTSGQFTSTLKDSEGISAVDSIRGIDSDGTNTPWCGNTDDKLYLTSGKFTSTLKTSVDVSAVEPSPYGVSYDNGDTPWVGNTDLKLYLTSGQFSSTLKDSEDVSGVDTSPSGIEHGDLEQRFGIVLVEPTGVLWSGDGGNKLYLQSGMYTTTVRDSEDISAFDTDPHGICWTGADVPWMGGVSTKMFLQSGLFTSTLKDSEDVSGVDTDPHGICGDGVNTVWTGRIAKKLYLQSGSFTSTLKTSEAVTTVDTIPEGCSAEANTPWGGAQANKLYLTSSQFTSTLKDSEDVSALGDVGGISFDGVNTPWSSGSVNILFVTSGQFTSTIKTSVNVTAVDNDIHGVAFGNFAVRMGIPPNPPALFRRFLHQKMPPIDRMRGRTVRWPYIHHFEEPTNVSKFRRFLRAKYPPIDKMKGRVVRSSARPPEWLEYAQTYEQGFRIADDSFDRYELFIGEGQAPDFTAAPAAVSSSLPFNYGLTPPLAGTTEFHIVVRKTNAYGLQSFNVLEAIRIIDTGGLEVLVDPRAPEDVVVYDAASGYLRVVASYLQGEDTNPADTWEIYVTEGSDPVPGSDVAAFSGSMKILGEDAVLNETVGTYTPGATAHVIVSVVRSSDGVRTSASVVQHVLAEAIDLSDGLMFGGSVYEQR